MSRNASGKKALIKYRMERAHESLKEYRHKHLALNKNRLYNHAALCPPF